MIPLCQAGLEYPGKAPALMPLGPPLPATMFVAADPAQTVLSVELVAVAAQESFQGISGMYPSADSRVTAALVGLQKVV